MLLQVNTNGVISFRFQFFEIFPLPLPLFTNDILIAPFWDVIDTFQGGQVLFRQTNNEDLLTQVGTTINDTFMVDFSPTSLLIVTWNSVPGFFEPNFVSIYCCVQALLIIIMPSIATLAYHVAVSLAKSLVPI